MKIITFYLPQFHQIPENDEWWGTGFTEWTNVKKAKKVYPGQKQPKVPLNNNYYNLMDKNTVQWQTELMHKYGIHGFCYFHYWFQGKQVLQKPAENLLEWKDIEQPFCFAWANVTWARTWTACKSPATTWISQDKGSAKNGILLEQTYGTEKDWVEHYQYLRQFFLDDRYIKIDNAPVFLIYRVEQIGCAQEMFKIWRDLARQDGFEGIHLVSMNTVPNKDLEVDAIVRFGNYGKYTRHYISFLKTLLKKYFKLPLSTGLLVNYKKTWEGILKEKPVLGFRTYPAAVVNYDDTPRRGKNAMYMYGASPQLFEHYLEKQIRRAKEIYHTDYMFLNAWNEWGEGNYLEPDVEHGYAYLEAVKNALRKSKK